jgi:hypothetical protein
VPRDGCCLDARADRTVPHAANLSGNSQCEHHRNA